MCDDDRRRWHSSNGKFFRWESDGCFVCVVFDPSRNSGRFRCARTVCVTENCWWRLFKPPDDVRVGRTNSFTPVRSTNASPLGWFLASSIKPPYGLSDIVMKRTSYYRRLLNLPAADQLETLRWCVSDVMGLTSANASCIFFGHSQFLCGGHHHVVTNIGRLTEVMFVGVWSLQWFYTATWDRPGPISPYLSVAACIFLSIYFIFIFFFPIL